MCGSKVVNRRDVLNDHQRIFGGLHERVKGIVVDVLRDVQRNLSGELTGLALEIMQAVMEYEVTTIAGVKGKHLRNRRLTRWGTNPGSVVIDGAKVPCAVPRVVDVESRSAHPVKTYGLFRQAGELIGRAYQDLIRGISTRRYSEGVSQFLAGHGISAPTVSRRMVVATSRKVQELFTRPLGDLELVVLMLDSVEIAGHTVVVALGIDSTGVKRILGLRQGATENSAVVKGLLEELIERGLSSERPILVVIDGAKALRKAVEDVLGKNTPVQRCTVHKKRNVLKHLGKSEVSWVSRRMSRAYDLSDGEKARKELLALVTQLEKINPSAARSLEEGLEETLTVQRLGLPEELRRSLRSTNIIESAINGVRERSRNVKRWRDGQQVERWTAAGLLETERNFRRIKGCRHMTVFLAALDKEQHRTTKAA